MPPSDSSSSSSSVTNIYCPLKATRRLPFGVGTLLSSESESGNFSSSLFLPLSLNVGGLPGFFVGFDIGFRFTGALGFLTGLKKISCDETTPYIEDLGLVPPTT